MPPFWADELVAAINRRVGVLKIHCPYHESDHILNIAFNAMCGGQTLDDIELRRNDAAFLNALQAEATPDPTTAGDFCRRFQEEDIHALMAANDEARLQVWAQQGDELASQTAVIEADGSIVPTTFYVTNDNDMPAEQVVKNANQRCNQENWLRWPGRSKRGWRCRCPSRHDGEASTELNATRGCGWSFAPSSTPSSTSPLRLSRPGGGS